MGDINTGVGDICIALGIIFIWGILSFIDLPLTVSSLVVDRLLSVVGLLFISIYLGLLYKVCWATFLRPLLRVAVWGALSPLLTYWGTSDRFPYGDVIAFYGTTFFQSMVGVLLLVMGYVWIWYHHYHVKHSFKH